MDTNNHNKSETIEVKLKPLEEDIKTAGISLLIPEWPPEDPDIFGSFGIGTGKRISAIKSLIKSIPQFVMVF